MYATTITKSGQISLNRSAREYLHVAPGNRVFVKIVDGGVLVRRLPTDEEFFAKLDAIKSAKTRRAIRQHAGQTVAELRSAPEYQRGYQAEYGAGAENAATTAGEATTASAETTASTATATTANTAANINTKEASHVH